MTDVTVRARKGGEKGNSHHDTTKAAAAHVLAATDTGYEGTHVTFVKNSAEGINRLKSQRIWSADGPGAWLTHAKPAGPRSRMPLETAENLEDATPIGAGGA